MKTDEISEVLLSNKMAVNLDMFCAFMKNKVLSNVDCNLAIRMEVNWKRRGNCDFEKKENQPGNRRATKAGVIATHGAMRIRARSPIRITKGQNFERRVRSKQ